MARPATKFANVSSDAERAELVEMWKTHHCHYTRMRAHAARLSGQGYSVSSLAEIFSVDRDSVTSWINRYNDGGIKALEDGEHPGAPRLLSQAEEEVLRQLFKEYPTQPRKVLSELEQQTGKSMSIWTLRNYARRLGLSWKRFRRSVRKKRNEAAFQQAREELAELIAEPDLNVVFFDEAGFSLKGVVPYGWQPVGERYEVPVTGSHGSSIQVLGFAGQDGSTSTYLHKGYVVSETVIQVFDSYCQTIDGPTVVILDNASCHTSAAFENKLEDWAKKGLYVYHIPPYSPELNSIERFWKKLKYQLMPATAWEHFTGLLQSLTSILAKIGEVSYMPSLHRYAE